METSESGRIVLEDDVPSPELFSKEAAYESLRFAFNENFIDEAERKIIEQQIDDSPLPARLSEFMKRMNILEDSIEEVFQMLSEEFSDDRTPDRFSSKDGATPDDAVHVHGKKTLH